MQVSEKKSLRDQLQSTRSALSAEEVNAASMLIRHRLLALPCLGSAQSILLYLPIRKEADTWELCEYFWNQNRQVLLPRCHDSIAGQMQIFEVQGKNDLGPGKFGITEPVPGKAVLYLEPNPDVIIVPALAFDEQGFRLGYGGGYYDRFLTNNSQRACLIGLAYDFQILASLPVEPWDYPVDIIVTPTRTIIPKENS